MGSSSSSILPPGKSSCTMPAKCPPSTHSLPLSQPKRVMFTKRGLQVAGLIVATRWHPAHVVCLPAPFACPLPSQLRRMLKMLLLFLIGRGGGGVAAGSGRWAGGGAGAWWLVARGMWVLVRQEGSRRSSQQEQGAGAAAGGAAAGAAAGGAAAGGGAAGGRETLGQGSGTALPRCRLPRLCWHAASFSASCARSSSLACYAQLTPASSLPLACKGTCARHCASPQRGGGKGKGASPSPSVSIAIAYSAHRLQLCGAHQGARSGFGLGYGHCESEGATATRSSRYSSGRS